MNPFKRRAFITVYQIGKLFGKYKQAAIGATSNGCRETDLFLCAMNNFQPHGFSLASGNTDAAPLNHPALVKTSDQQSFISSNFSPYPSAEALRSSDTRHVSSLN
jgi:hypothetical protein